MDLKETISSCLVDLYEKSYPLWDSATYKFATGSGESISYTSESILYDNQNNLIQIEDYSLIRIDDQIQDAIIALVKEQNKLNRVNKVIVNFENKCLKAFSVEWDEAVHEESIKYYSKVKLKKMRAWYLPDEETPPVLEVKQVLPKAGVSLNTTSLTLDKAFSELNKVVTYKDDPLWDGGSYSIKKNQDGGSGHADLYLFDSFESKEKNWGADEVNCDLVITEEMKALFLYIQAQYLKLNHAVPYDALFVTVQRDGIRYVTNFELEGEEVYPTAPPQPETITAAYLCQNLHNCLAHNAPGAYKWVWEILKRTQTSDGKTQMEGDFYYSLQEDKGNPQRLEPGEYVYMYNVSERLFDEFFATDTNGWSEIALYFSKEGKASFKILKK